MVRVSICRVRVTEVLVVRQVVPNLGVMSEHMIT